MPGRGRPPQSVAVAPTGIPAGPGLPQERPSLCHSWPTLARVGALSRDGQGGETAAHKAKKPATAGAGRAEGWACAATY